MADPLRNPAQDDQLTDLVTRIQGKDESAIAEVIDLTQMRLMRFCFHLSGNRQMAEDLCQEALVKAVKQIQTLKDPSSFLGWLFRIAKNQFLDEVRRRSNTDEILQEEGVENEPAGLAGHTPAHDSNLEIRQALMQLDPSDREVLILVDIEEYSYLEAAEMLKISENALRSRVFRARQTFLKIFNQA